MQVCSLQINLVKSTQALRRSDVIASHQDYNNIETTTLATGKHKNKKSTKVTKIKKKTKGNN